MAASNMFIKAPKDDIFHKVYQKKMSDESFINKQSFEATRSFLKKDRAAFWAYSGHIPDDVVCKVSPQTIF